jgi:hypothetical protein
MIILISKDKEESTKRVPISNSEEFNFITNIISIVVLDYKVGLII